MIDDLRVEADEDGWHLILHGDMESVVQKWSTNLDGCYRVNLRLSDEAAAQLVGQVEPIREHLAEGEAVRREFEASGRVSWDEHRAALEADPAEDARAGADLFIKTAKENPPC